MRFCSSYRLKLWQFFGTFLEFPISISKVFQYFKLFYLSSRQLSSYCLVWLVIPTKLICNVGVCSHQPFSVQIALKRVLLDTCLLLRIVRFGNSVSSTKGWSSYLYFVMNPNFVVVILALGIFITKADVLFFSSFSSVVGGWFNSLVIQICK